MKMRLALVAAIAAAGLTLAGPGAVRREPARHVVEIRGFAFHPENLVVSPGDTVRWVNRDLVLHSATADDGSWGSTNLANGEAWELVVEGDGLQAYRCALHPQMVGALEVR